MNPLPTYRLELLEPLNGKSFFDYTRAWDFRFIMELLPKLKCPTAAFLIDFTEPVEVPLPDGTSVMRRYFNGFTKRRLKQLASVLSRDDLIGVLESIYADHFNPNASVRNPFGLLFHRAALLLNGANTPD